MGGPLRKRGKTRAGDGRGEGGMAPKEKEKNGVASHRNEKTPRRMGYEAPTIRGGAEEEKSSRKGDQGVGQWRDLIVNLKGGDEDQGKTRELGYRGRGNRTFDTEHRLSKTKKSRVTSVE